METTPIQCKESIINNMSIRQFVIAQVLPIIIHNKPENSLTEHMIEAEQYADCFIIRNVKND